MKKIQYKPLIFSFALAYGVALLSWLISRGGMEQYGQMYRPPLSPPAWVFPVVWTILFGLMAVSAYLIYISDSTKKESALRLYVFQLLVNFCWPFLFFELHLFILALAWLILLWYLVLQMIRQFSVIDPLAGKLQIPYLIWLTFAAYLNAAIVYHYYF